MANTREFLLFTDTTMANPNGDMINENRPRTDEETGKLEMSDVRIKRYFRDEAAVEGLNVFVKPTKNDKGKYLDCKGAAKAIYDANFKKGEDDKFEQYLKDNYIDVKLFGAVVTDPKFNIAGPLQVMWSRSIHEAEVKFAQGSASFASKGEASQGTIWSKYFTPYALFRTYMVYNDMTAKKQNISVSEEDIESFKEILISGIRNYKSTSKNQMPRLLAEVIYNKNYIDGELDYIDVKYDKDDLKLRSIDDFTFDLSKLYNYYKENKDVIKQINIYAHSKVKLQNIPDEFNLKNI